MSKASRKLTPKELKDFSVHLPNVKITKEEESKRFNNLKDLLAKARNSTTPRK